MRARKVNLSKIIILAIAFIVGAGAFSISTVDVEAASKKPYKVKITSIKSVDHNAIKLTWKKAKYAKKYKIYRATSKYGKYKLIKTTKARTYTNKKLTTGKRYYYKVRAVNGSRYGKFSYRKSAVPKLNKVKFSSVTTGDSWAEIKYTKVNGAQGYLIYRATEKNGKYKKVGSTTKLTFKNESLNDNKIYYYKVKAYKKVNGSYKYGSLSGWKYIKTEEHIHDWIEQFDKNDLLTGLQCTLCKDFVEHFHSMYNVYDENSKLLGEECYDCKGFLPHKHSWTLCEENYFCSCGESVPLEHDCQAFEVPVYGDVDIGTKQEIESKITYCNNCEKHIDGTAENHLNTVHVGESASCMELEGCGSHQEWVSNIVNDVIGYKCEVCDSITSHFHEWEPVYQNGYFTTIQTEEVWCRCNGCGLDVTDDDVLMMHTLSLECVNEEGFPWGYTEHTRHVDTEHWIEAAQIHVGYSCSTCGATK